jgi:hypothetical protein
MSTRQVPPLHPDRTATLTPVHRYDFYQTDTHLIISIYKKGIPADQVRVVAHAEDVRTPSYGSRTSAEEW